MNARFRTSALALAIAAATACQQPKSGVSSTPTPFVGVTASASSVVANGSNTVTINVTNTGSGSVTVTTTRGTFASSGTSSTTVSGASGTLVLQTCNGSTAGCVGDAVVTATGSAGTASVTVKFGSVAATCQTNCAADPGCVGLSCNLTGGGTGACSSNNPSTCVAGAACTPNPPSATSETSCSDGIDNDCNGMKDCKDAACDGQPCLVGSPTFVCKSGACTDISTGLAVTVTPARDRLPANGSAQTVVEVVVTASTDPAVNLPISVSTTLGTITTATATTNAAGKATFTFTTSATAGVATITAQLSSLPTVKGIARITIPRLGSLRLVQDPNGSVQFPVMGAKSSGWQDFGWIKIQALDDVGLPYPDGLAVRFEHRPLGVGVNASTLRGPLAADTASCVAPGCVGYLGTIDSGDEPDTTGLANAWIYSGTVAGTLAVTASATADGVTSTVDLPTIAVVGAKASGANFSIVCGPRNLPALAETDCSISLVDAPFSCEALLKDRFNNVLGRSTQVIFASEAASVGQPAWTPDYDPANTGDQQMKLGLAVEGFRTLGAGLPFDVDPDTSMSEPWVLHALDGCGPRIHNPRDGLVTVIAIADGEEAYFDANGNGSYDVGEPFVDLGEPYVDQNDNGQYDPGEWFLDVDGNGVWTPPNGRWDANTKIWTQTVVLYTGGVETMIPAPGGNFLATRIGDSTFVDACTPSASPASFDVLSATSVQAATTDSYSVVASDLNLNFLTMRTTYGVKASDGSSIKVFYGGLTSYTDLIGMDYRFWPCDRAGKCASQCRSTGPNAPCLMTPLVSGYSCGLSSSFSVTGGEKAEFATVYWDVDVPWDVYGGTAGTKIGRIQHGGAAVSGVVWP
jgi:hypothetical protein